jgi:ribonuclease HI
MAFVFSRAIATSVKVQAVAKIRDIYVPSRIKSSSKLIRRPRSYQEVFTDGSVRQNGKYIGIGLWYSYDDYKNKSYMLMGRADSNRAELCAIYTALVLSPLSGTLQVNTDSETSIKMIHDSYNYNKSFNKFDPLLLGILWLIKYCRNDPTIIAKVKAHANEVGNNNADRLAKTAENGMYLYMPDNTEKEVLRHLSQGHHIIYPSVLIRPEQSN